MTTAAIRKKLINYIADADEKKVKGMYLLFEEEIEKEKEFVLTEEHMKILEEEKESTLVVNPNHILCKRPTILSGGKENSNAPTHYKARSHRDGQGSLRLVRAAKQRTWRNIFIRAE